MCHISQPNFYQSIGNLKGKQHALCICFGFFEFILLSQNIYNIKSENKLQNFIKKSGN